MKKNISRITFANMLMGAFLLAGTRVDAAPLQLDFSGTVSSATGTWASDTDSAFGGSVVIDLDGNNAYDVETFSPVGEPVFTRWIFVGPPYIASFSGVISSLSDNVASVETLDNFDTDAFGNPFGLTGIRDVMTVNASSTIVDCSGGTVDPILGCDDPDAPALSGEEFQLVLVAPSNWFSGNVLPPSIPSLAELTALVGEGDSTSGGVEVATAEMEYTSLSVTSLAAPVPGLSPIGMTVLLGSLLGLGLRRGYARIGGGR